MRVDGFSPTEPARALGWSRRVVVLMKQTTPVLRATAAAKNWAVATTAPTPTQTQTPKLIIGFCGSTETTNQAESTIKTILQAYSTRNCVTTYVYKVLNAKNFNK